MEEMNAPTYPAKTAWLGLGVAYLGLMAVGAMFHMVPPLLPEVLRDLGLNHGQGGVLMSTFALPGLLLSLYGGWLVDRFGAYRVGAAGLLVMGLASLGLARAVGFPIILVARLVSGVGSVLAMLGAQRMVTLLFGGRPLGLPMGVAGSAIPCGIIIIYNLAGPLSRRSGWRAVPWQLGLAALLTGALLLVLGHVLLRERREHRTAGMGPRAATEKAVAGRPAAGTDEKTTSVWAVVWAAGLVWFLANGAMTAFLTFVPDHFLTMGLGVRDRGLVTSMPLWISASMGPPVGLMADRFGGKAQYVTVGMGVMTATLLLVAYNQAAPLLVGMGLGLAMALLVTPLLSMPGELLPPSHHGRGFGILNTSANGGFFLLPPLAGFLRDGSAGYFLPFIMMAAVGLVGILAGVVLARLYGKWKA
ncbi:hypothetical protein CSB20_01830 [bacterium DOLZORAL124_64_63]|nr:MAG: hypothetical protein CSB20_01830 [bacterium DOLZORAL124_64_63]